MIGMNVKGIDWEITKQNGKPVYTHHNIRIIWDSEAGLWKTKDLVGKLIIAREFPSDAIKDTTIVLLEMYARRLIPSWKV